MMATTFSAAGYLASIQALLDRHSVPATVHGFSDAHQRQHFAMPCVEVVIDRVPTQSTGAPRELSGMIEGRLVVMDRCTRKNAELATFELALNVATALDDEMPDGAAPLFPAGPMLVGDIEPDYPDPILDDRFVGFSIQYRQEIYVRRTNQPAEPDPPTDLYTHAYPEVGDEDPAYQDDYDQLVADGEPV